MKKDTSQRASATQKSSNSETAREVPQRSAGEVQRDSTAELVSSGLILTFHSLETHVNS
jgi:hypothetical protein